MSKRSKTTINYEGLLRGERDAVSTVGTDKKFDMESVLTILFPAYGLAKMAKSFFGSSDAVSEGDADRIEGLIAKGKEQGVDEMEIRLDRKRVAGLRGKLKAKGADAEILAGGEGDSAAKIRIKYK